MAEKNALNKGKFYEALVASGDEVKGKRGEILVKSVRKAANKKVEAIDDEIDALETKLLNLTDLGPENTYSLRPTSQDFDANAWVNELHETRLAIALKRIELAEAQAIVKEWF